MTVNSNFQQQDSDNPVQGGYIQPGGGITGAIVAPSDPSGNAYATSLASAGVANLQTAAYKDSAITVQVATQAVSPGVLGAVATITPGTAGLWEISGSVSITGTTVAANESNNLQLRQTTTARLANIPIAVNGVTGAPGAAPFGPIVLNLSAVDTVNVVSLLAATTGAIYGAQIVARRVG